MVRNPQRIHLSILCLDARCGLLAMQYNHVVQPVQEILFLDGILTCFRSPSFRRTVHYKSVTKYVAESGSESFTSWMARRITRNKQLIDHKQIHSLTVHSCIEPALKFGFCLVKVFTQKPLSPN
jgi:hypothetical protein